VIKKSGQNGPKLDLQTPNSSLWRTHKSQPICGWSITLEIPLVIHFEDEKMAGKSKRSPQERTNVAPVKLASDEFARLLEAL
jgi:hypothetical protein